MGSCWAYILDCIIGLVMLRDQSSLNGSSNPGLLTQHPLYPLLVAKNAWGRKCKLPVLSKLTI